MIPNEFWERFKNEKIAVNCQTEDEAKDFVRQCRNNKINCEVISSKINLFYDTYKENTCYSYNNCNYLVYSDYYYYKKKNYTIIPFSEINKSIKEENKMQVKPNEYTYRGQAFSDVEEYAKYILKCKEEDRVKAEKERQDKLKVDKARRTEEVDRAYVEYFETCTEAKEKYLKIVEQYNKDYGYEIKEKYPYLDDIFDSIQKVFKL